MAAAVTFHCRHPAVSVRPDTVASAVASKSPPDVLQGLFHVAFSSKEVVSLWAVSDAPLPVEVASHNESLALVICASAGISLA